MKRWYVGYVAGFLLLLSSFQVHAGTVPVNLGSFYADSTVTVGSDGNSAMMLEDSQRFTVFLSNDPTMGDPGIQVPTGTYSLSFHYSFVKGPGNDDDFYVKAFDGKSGAIIHDLLTSNTNSGMVSWTLEGLDPSSNLLGLEFQLRSWDTATDSSVGISDVQLAPVPVPTTFFLLSSGLAALCCVRRKQN